MGKTPKKSRESKSSKSASPAKPAKRKNPAAKSKPAKPSKPAPKRPAPTKKTPPPKPKPAPKKTPPKPAPKKPAPKKRPTPSAPATSAGKLVDALESIRDIFGASLGRAFLRTTNAPLHRPGTPWLLIADLKGWKPVPYGAISVTLAKVARNRPIMRAIGENRLARIKVTYEGVRHHGRKTRTERDWTVGEVSSWDAVLARAINELNPDSVGTIASRYSEGINRAFALGVTIWLSSMMARDWMPDDEG